MRFAVVGMVHWFLPVEMLRNIACRRLLILSSRLSFSPLSRTLFYAGARPPFWFHNPSAGCARLYKIITHGWQVKGAIRSKHCDRVWVWWLRSCLYLHEKRFYFASSPTVKWSILLLRIILLHHASFLCLAIKINTTSCSKIRVIARQR